MQPALFFEPGPFPGLPGPAVGPKGPKIGQKPGAGFIILSSLGSAQFSRAAPVRHLLAKAPSISAKAGASAIRVHPALGKIRGPGRCLKGRRPINLVLCVTQWCFRAVNRSSWPDFGRTANGKTAKSFLRPAFGRPEGRFRRFPGRSQATIRPGRPIPGPEALLCDIG